MLYVICSAIWLVPCWYVFVSWLARVKARAPLQSDYFGFGFTNLNWKPIYFQAQVYSIIWNTAVARQLLNIFLAIYAMTPGAVTFWSRCLYIYVTHSTSTTLESHNSEVFNVVFCDFIFFMYICSCISVVKPFPAK